MTTTSLLKTATAWLGSLKPSAGTPRRPLQPSADFPAGVMIRWA